MHSAPRLLAIVGSGETAPGMVRFHRELLGTLEHVDGVILDTPCGFQENAATVVGKLQDYFATRLGQPLAIATMRNADHASATELERFAADVAAANYVFSGPGSPSYAARHWLKTPLPALLRTKFQEGGVTVFSSGAAVTLGTYAAPIYEMYKVGEAPHWRDGLDVLAPLGLRTAVLPHFDNREGGDHDTRCCYIGERRLHALEALLDPDVLVIGVDEHTVALIDGATGELRVMGRGGVTLRQRGVERRSIGTDTVDLTALREPGATVSAPPAAPSDGDGVAARCAAALAAGDVDAVVECLLLLQADGSADAATALRRGVLGLGDLARAGAGTSEAVNPLVEAILELRGQAREDQHFALADQLRDVLTSVGVDVRDTADGAVWERA